MKKIILLILVASLGYSKSVLKEVPLDSNQSIQEIIQTDNEIICIVESEKKEPHGLIVYFLDKELNIKDSLEFFYNSTNSLKEYKYDSHILKQNVLTIYSRFWRVILQKIEIDLFSRDTTVSYFEDSLETYIPLATPTIEFQNKLLVPTIKQYRYIYFKEFDYNANFVKDHPVDTLFEEESIYNEIHFHNTALVKGNRLYTYIAYLLDTTLVRDNKFVTFDEDLEKVQEIDLPKLEGGNIWLDWKPTTNPTFLQNGNILLTGRYKDTYFYRNPDNQIYFEYDPNLNEFVNEKYYPEDSLVVNFDILPTEDGGFFTCGMIGENEFARAMITKFDKDLNKEFEWVYEDDKTSLFSHLQFTEDGNLLAGGRYALYPGVFTFLKLIENPLNSISIQKGDNYKNEGNSIVFDKTQENVKIFDINGLEIESFSRIQRINLNNYASGIYFITYDTMSGAIKILLEN
jgi:predicted nucleic acid-binding protein